MKKLLFVDDQWCRRDERSTIIASFGALTRGEDSYEFIYETAETYASHYGTAPVLKMIAGNPEIEAVICDMNFGEQRNFGLNILRAIKASNPDLPVIIMSSLDRKEAAEEACAAGADGYLIKKPMLEELKKALEKVRR